MDQAWKRSRGRLVRWALVAVSVLLVAASAWLVVREVKGPSRADAIRDATRECGLESRYDWTTLREVGTREAALGGTLHVFEVYLAGERGKPSGLREFSVDEEVDPVVGSRNDPVWVNACVRPNPAPTLQIEPLPSPS